MEYKYQAIILNKVDVGETDRIYAFYSQEAGRIRALANGVRKSNAKLAGSLEPLTFSEIFVAKNRGQGRITGALTINNFSEIKNNLIALQKVFFALGVFERFVTQEEKDEKLFEIIFNYFKEMNNLSGSISSKNETLEVLTLGFIFKLLNYSGYAFEVKKCSNCGQNLGEEKNNFSFSRGGVICFNCSSSVRKKIIISNETIKLMRIFSDNEIKNFKKIKISEKISSNLRFILNEIIANIDN